MHYGNRKQILKNELVVIIYKHGTPRKNIFDHQITSIQSCKYFPPVLLKKLLENPNKYFSIYFKNYKGEIWYKTKIVSADGISKIKITSIQDVSHFKNELLRLH